MLYHESYFKFLLGFISWKKHLLLTKHPEVPLEGYTCLLLASGSGAKVTYVSSRLQC